MLTQYPPVAIVKILIPADKFIGTFPIRIRIFAAVPIPARRIGHHHPQRTIGVLGVMDVVQPFGIAKPLANSRSP